MRKIILAALLALIPQAAFADFAVGTGNFPYAVPSSISTNCVLVASSTTALTCTTSPAINGTDINAGTIPSSSLGTVGLAQGGTGQVTANAALNALLPSQTGNAGLFLKTDGAGYTSWAAPAGTGTVTSVRLTRPADFSVSGSPVTTSGTLTVTRNTQSANTFQAGPTSGAAAVPTYRAIVAGDINSLSPSFTNLAATQGCIGMACA